jgi:hypothetical protein
MIIQISADARPAELLDIDDLGRFKVVVKGQLTDEEIQASLASLGRLDPPKHAWISIDALKTASDRENNPDWQLAFAGMVAYAASNGWLDDSGIEMRAHLEYISTS